MIVTLPETIDGALDSLSEDQMHLLHRKLAERLHKLRDDRDLERMAQLKVTDRVQFDHAGSSHTGMIIKLNRRTATIITDEGRHWNVSPCYLRRILETEAVDAEIVEEQGESENPLWRLLRYIPRPGTGRNRKKHRHGR
ncbi:hypothetical protein HY285_03495 [Candidatus Peregrinibacteria bacterium]|nr:hypothetical protein [Candidatus Peregrinibacteria bacterium]MBI3816580.1 hypothetical protein [Candidatus Peregrinibacteria bacterium]